MTTHVPAWGRDITEAELARVASNAAGEHVYAADSAGARTIARDALDAWDELTEESQGWAVEHAMAAWQRSRGHS